MTRRYTHLQAEERLTLSSLLQQGHSLRYIARILQRSPSTLSRQVARNSTTSGYASRTAQQACQQRRQRARPWPKLHPQSALWAVVRHLLARRWSPQQIASILKRMHPDDRR